MRQVMKHDQHSQIKPSLPQRRQLTSTTLHIRFYIFIFAETAQRFQSFESFRTAPFTAMDSGIFHPV